jgi:putative transposase
MAECEDELLATLGSVCDAVYAWCVLPNHYHVLVHIADLRALSAALGRLHGRTAFRWNGEDGRRGCHVWHRCTDRRIRSDRHFWATLNYVHHNPVHHGYAKGWEDWPFSSAGSFLRAVGRDKAATLWKAYPLLDYGRGWDEPGL